MLRLIYFTHSNIFARLKLGGLIHGLCCLTDLDLIALSYPSLDLKPKDLDGVKHKQMNWPCSSNIFGGDCISWTCMVILYVIYLFPITASHIIFYS